MARQFLNVWVVMIIEFRMCWIWICLSMLCLGNVNAAGCLINFTEVNFGEIRIADFQKSIWRSSAYPVDLLIDCRASGVEEMPEVMLTELGAIFNGHSAKMEPLNAELTLRANWRNLSSGTILTQSPEWLNAIRTGLQNDAYLVIPLLLRLDKQGGGDSTSDELLRLVGPFSGQLQWLLKVESTQHLISFSYRGSFTNGTCQVKSQTIDFGDITTADIRQGIVTRDIQLMVYCDGLSIPKVIQFKGDGEDSEFYSASAKELGIAITIKSNSEQLRGKRNFIESNEVIEFFSEREQLQSTISIPLGISIVPLGGKSVVSGGRFTIPITVKFTY